MPVILNFFNTRDLHSRCAAHTQSNWWWCDLFQIVRSRENHKVLKDKAWQERAQQTEKSYSHTNSAVSRQVLKFM